jgi:possible lipid-A-disaccharide synthase
LIQNDLTTKNIKSELEKILNPEQREKILNEYEKLNLLLGGKGASERAAEIITKLL